jgi:Tfp pilus assembly protein PilZ
MAKRSAPRKIKRLPVTFSDGNVEYTGTSSDFSLTGVFIRTRKALDPGTQLRIVLEVDEDRKIELRGIVVRSIKTGIMEFKNGMGIKLTFVPKEYEDFVKALD